MSDAREVRLAPGPGGFRYDIPVLPGMFAGISGAAAGTMALSRRAALPWRSKLFGSLGIAEGRCFGLRQVHSRQIVVVDEQEPEALAGIEADGMITIAAHPVLTVTVADCLPIFLADRRTGAFGLVHSGWKGTGIVVEAIRAMAARFGTRAADLSVTVGPGIGACCYQVPEERAERFASEFGSATVARDSAGNPSLDLRAANVALARREGVAEVSVVMDCTSCSTSLGSFRRQGPGRFTLMLAFLGRG